MKNTATNLLGTKVYDYFYSTFDGKNYDGNRNNLRSEVYDVLLQNEDTIVISDKDFTSIKTKSTYTEITTDNAWVNIYIEDEYYGNGIIFRLYSTKDLSSDAIKEIIIGTTKKKLKGIGNMDMNKLKTKLDEVIK